MLELTRVEVFAPGFRLRASDGDENLRPEKAIHYRGTVKGDPDSLAAVSVFRHEVMGIYRTREEGAVVLGLLDQGGGGSGEHVLYRERDLSAKNPFQCETGDSSTLDAPVARQVPEAPRCVRIYFEADYDLFQNKGSVGGVVNYVTGLFNQAAILYQNEGIPTAISEIFVWTSPSPYTGASSHQILQQFQSFRTSFNGDIGHLVALRPNTGGVAAGFSGFCNPNRAQSQCYSGIQSTFANVPTYSWTVEVVTHEMGHLMGSRHTHACVWNGNNTAIDGCAGFVEGSCPLPGIPPGGGTIMSYCHLTSAGINFNNGFGPQPGAVIRGGFNGAGCLIGCGDPNIKMIASYVPRQGFPRTTFTSTSQNPPSFDFFYNEALGNFEQRPGAPCNGGQNNPTYLKVNFQTPPISACSFQASWDSAPITCSAAHVQAVNSGAVITLNTDRYGTNPATCQLFQPLRSVLPFNQPGWFRVNLVINGVTYTRRINIIKRNQ